MKRWNGPGSVDTDYSVTSYSVSPKNSRITSGIVRIKLLPYIMIFGRYCNASARCGDCISSLPAKSAIVRASLRMR